MLLCVKNKFTLLKLFTHVQCMVRSLMMVMVVIMFGTAVEVDSYTDLVYVTIQMQKDSTQTWGKMYGHTK